jgi:site-specific recombinase XerD
LEELMIETYYKHPHSLRYYRSGATGVCIDAYATRLAEEGYSQVGARNHIRGVAHLGHWLQDKAIPLETLDESIVKLFFEYLPTARFMRKTGKGKFDPCYDAARHFLCWARQAGVVKTTPPQQPVPPLIEEFEMWMARHRGVTLLTLRDVYRRPLLRYLDAAGEDPAQYDAAGIRRFILAEAKRVSTKTAKTSASALRQLLRFLALMGRCRPEIVDAVPTIANWRLSALPTFIAPALVERIISTCDVSTIRGRRGRAMLLLMARLGMRASDVAALRIGDIDWKDATLSVFGKGRRRSRLPLPQDVGDALLAWLQDGRPDVDDDHVFLRLYAPIRPYNDGQSISAFAAKAAQKAGVELPRSGSHVLRHSAATALLEEGMSLAGIGALLRHNSLDTTAIYAKVDQRMLTTVARPWPIEVAP